MSISNEKTLERVRKLLALSDNNNSPEEAALAAGRAAALMEAHSITMAEIEDGEGDEIVEETFGVPGSHRSGQLKCKSTWQGELAALIAEGFGCACVWNVGKRSARLSIAGRADDVRAAILAKEFCHREIDRLTAKFSRGRGRSWGVAFRVGCCQSIREAITTERAAVKAMAREEMEKKGGVNETALVVVDTRAKEALESFGEIRTRRSNLRPNAEAFMAGRVVGQNVWSGTKARLEG